MDEIPFFAIGNDELANLPRLKKGDKIAHKESGEICTVEAAKNEDGSDSDMVLFTQMADGKPYLVGVDGKLLSGWSLVS